MRNLIVGGIAALWSGAVLVSALVRGGPRGEGAYLAGQISALLFAALVFVVGLYYFIDGVKTVREQPRKSKKRKRKRARRVAEEESEE